MSKPVLSVVDEAWDIHPHAELVERIKGGIALLDPLARSELGAQEPGVVDALRIARSLGDDRLALVVADRRRMRVFDLPVAGLISEMRSGAALVDVALGRLSISLPPGVGLTHLAAMAAEHALETGETPALAFLSMLLHNLNRPVQPGPEGCASAMATLLVHTVQGQKGCMSFASGRALLAELRKGLDPAGPSAA